jgi:hypothetical protein
VPLLDFLAALTEGWTASPVHMSRRAFDHTFLELDVHVGVEVDAPAVNLVQESDEMLKGCAQAGPPILPQSDGLPVVLTCIENAGEAQLAPPNRVRRCSGKDTLSSCGLALNGSGFPAVCQSVAYLALITL